MEEASGNEGAPPPEEGEGGGKKGELEEDLARAKSTGQEGLNPKGGGGVAPSSTGPSKDQMERKELESKDDSTLQSYIDNLRKEIDDLQAQPAPPPSQTPPS